MMQAQYESLRVQDVYTAAFDECLLMSEGDVSGPSWLTSRPLLVSSPPVCYSDMMNITLLLASLACFVCAAVKK